MPFNGLLETKEKRRGGGESHLQSIVTHSRKQQRVPGAPVFVSSHQFYVDAISMVEVW